MKFLIVDAGGNFLSYAEKLVEQLQKDGNHVIFFYTDHPNLMCIEEVTEDEFLDCFIKDKNTK